MHMPRIIVMSVVCLVLLSGCGATKAKPEGEAIAQEYFSAMKEGKIDNVLHLYSKDFFGSVSRVKWKSMLEKINNKLGNVQTYELATWNVTSMAGTGKVGTYVTLVYNIQYQKYKGTESFNMFKPATGGAIKILGHNINSEGLILEGNEEPDVPEKAKNLEKGAKGVEI